MVILICLCLIILLSRIYQILCVPNLTKQDLHDIPFKYYPSLTLDSNLSTKENLQYNLNIYTFIL